MENQISIRFATPEDLPAIQEVAKFIEEVYSPSIVANTKMMYYLFIAELKGFFLIAENLDNNEIIGFVIGLATKKEKVLWLHQIAVSPNHKSKYLVGLKLLNALEVYAKNEGYEEIKGAVNAINKAIILYKKMNYQYREEEKITTLSEMKIGFKNLRKDD